MTKELARKVAERLIVAEAAVEQLIVDLKQADSTLTAQGLQLAEALAAKALLEDALQSVKDCGSEIRFERDKAIAEARLLRSVLRWYGDRNHYLPVCDHDATTGAPLPVMLSIADWDCGARARQVTGEG